MYYTSLLCDFFRLLINCLTNSFSFGLVGLPSGTGVAKSYNLTGIMFSGDVVTFATSSVYEMSCNLTVIVTSLSRGSYAIFVTRFLADSSVSIQTVTRFPAHIATGSVSSKD